MRFTADEHAYCKAVTSTLMRVDRHRFLTCLFAADHGGKYDFISWAGLDTSDGYQFYTSSAVKKIFKDYIKVLLTHVNQYTGVSRSSLPISCLEPDRSVLVTGCAQGRPYHPG